MRTRLFLRTKNCRMISRNFRRCSTNVRLIATSISLFEVFQQCMGFRFLKMPAFRTNLTRKQTLRMVRSYSEVRAFAVQILFSSKCFRRSDFRHGACGEMGIDALLGIRPVAFLLLWFGCPALLTALRRSRPWGHASLSGNRESVFARSRFREYYRSGCYGEQSHPGHHAQA